MELEQIIRLLSRRLWIILLALILAGGVAYAVRASQPPTYRATVLISIGRSLTVASPNTSDIEIGNDLAPTYIELLKRDMVLQTTITALNLPVSTAALAKQIDTTLVPNTSLLTVGVTWSDPKTAARIANELTQQLIINSPTNLTSDQQTQLKMTQNQVDTLNTQISQNRDQLNDIERQIARTSDANVLSTLNSQRNTLLDQIDRATSSVAQFSSIITTLQQRPNSLTVLEQAQVPTVPEDSGALRIALLGAVIGGAFAVGAVVLVGYWDTSVKTPNDVTKALNIPVLGTIVRYGKRSDSYAQRLVNRDSERVSVFERYRAIEAYLFLKARRADIYKPVFIMTSAEPGEGKSLTSANLAFVAASMGRRVLLIDADLHNPKIHEIFQLNNYAGLVTLLTASLALKSSSENMSFVLASSSQTTLTSPLINSCIQSTALPNLRVITAGPVTTKSLQLLESHFLPRWIDIFKFYVDVDMIIIDSAPCLVVTDASVLAGSIPSKVILVAEAGRTRPEVLLQAKNQFTQIGNTPVGVILNKADPRDDASAQKYAHYLAEAADTNNRLALPEVTKPNSMRSSEASADFTSS